MWPYIYMMVNIIRESINKGDLLGSCNYKYTLKNHADREPGTFLLISVVFCKE